MRITLVAIRTASAKKSSMESLVQDYLQRMSPMATSDSVDLASEERLVVWLKRETERGAIYTVFLDSRGQQYSSEQLAAAVGRQRDAGKRHLVFAIGPADGWSPASQCLASLQLSLGLMTLPHELARLVVAEQVYRALTILAGHPYHSGH